jgi:UDP-3-O-[3-hydroxymyristoyl] N-acetylglucosamine deacetylase
MPHNFSSGYQHTLNDSITVIGRGLHTGLQVIMTLMPAEANSQYVFMRRDVEANRAEVPARWNTVVDTRLSTTVANASGVRVSTIEHLLAALSICGVDNVRIVLDAPEVPIMDGSAAPFVELIKKVGLRRQLKPKQAIVIDQPITVRDQGKYATLMPAKKFSVGMTIDFENSVIGQQSMVTPINERIFHQQLASARTFGFQEQLDTLHKLGLAKGGSLKNAVLIKDNKVVNEEGLRFKNEFVRHKIIDTLGDLSLAGANIIGKFDGHRCGHQLNNQLLRKLMSSPDLWHYEPAAQHHYDNEVTSWQESPAIAEQTFLKEWKESEHMSVL